MAKLEVRTAPFGATEDGRAVTRIDLMGADGSGISVLDLGAAVLEVRVPDRHGRIANVVLGYADLGGYLANAPYFGVIVGRCANRIAGAAFGLDGRVHALHPNEGRNQLHGGPGGFHTRVWTLVGVAAGPAAPGPSGGAAAGTGDRAAVTLGLVSDDGDQGYPGRLEATASLAWTAGHEFDIVLEATCDAPTLVNLAHHGYWNLAGEGAGTVDDHRLTVRANAFLPVDAELLPSGELRPVDGTPFDLRGGRRLGDVVRADDPQVAGARGIDHCFVLDRAGAGRDDLVEAAVLHEPSSGRTLRLSTTEPGLQVYAGGYLDGAIVGRAGRRYRQGDGLALEPQGFPDAIHRPGFPEVVLRPGEVYRQRTTFAFSVA
jgi:aldose 1-epimerase